MFSRFKKKKEKLVSPADSYLVSLSKVDDSVFSQGTMGSGFDIEP